MKSINIVSKKIRVASFTRDLPLLKRIASEYGFDFAAMEFTRASGGDLAGNPVIRQAATYDIVFCDSSIGIPLEEMGRLLGPKPSLVACLTPEEEASLTDEEARPLSDIWLLPLAEARAKLRMRNLASAIEEAWLAALRAAWLDTLMELIPDMVWIKKADGSHVKVNQVFCAACGKTRRMIEGRKHGYIWNVGPEDARDCQISEEEVIRSGGTGTFEEILKIGDKQRKLRTHKAALLDPDGNIFGTMGVANDITNLLNLDLELRIFVDAMPFPLLMVDDNGAITHMNSRFLEFFGETDGDMLNVEYKAWKEWALEAINDDDATAPDSHDYALKDDKSGRIVQVTERDLVDVFGAFFGHVSIFRDVTAQRELQRQIWRNANVDSLTGLANRHGFQAFLKKCKELPKHLIYMDLDNFKAVNDKYGHKAGDEALKIMAAQMKECFPKDFAMRQGGDEFMICINRDISREEVEAETQKMCQQVGEIFASYVEYADVAISAGISSHGNCIEDMTREADSAMYEYKKNMKQKRKAAKDR